MNPLGVVNHHYVFYTVRLREHTRGVPSNGYDVTVEQPLISPNNRLSNLYGGAVWPNPVDTYCFACFVGGKSVMHVYIKVVGYANEHIDRLLTGPFYNAAGSPLDSFIEDEYVKTEYIARDVYKWSYDNRLFELANYVGKSIVDDIRSDFHNGYYRRDAKKGLIRTGYFHPLQGVVDLLAVAGSDFHGDPFKLALAVSLSGASDYPIHIEVDESSIVVKYTQGHAPVDLYLCGDYFTSAPRLTEGDWNGIVNGAGNSVYDLNGYIAGPFEKSAFKRFCDDCMSSLVYTFGFTTRSKTLIGNHDAPLLSFAEGQFKKTIVSYSGDLESEIDLKRRFKEIYLVASTRIGDLKVIFQHGLFTDDFMREIADLYTFDGSLTIGKCCFKKFLYDFVRQLERNAVFTTYEANSTYTDSHFKATAQLLDEQPSELVIVLGHQSDYIMMSSDDEKQFSFDGNYTVRGTRMRESNSLLKRLLGLTQNNYHINMHNDSVLNNVVAIDTSVGTVTNIWRSHHLLPFIRTILGWIADDSKANFVRVVALVFGRLEFDRMYDVPPTGFSKLTDSSETSSEALSEADASSETSDDVSNTTSDTSKNDSSKTYTEQDILNIIHPQVLPNKRSPSQSSQSSQSSRSPFAGLREWRGLTGGAPSSNQLLIVVALELLLIIVIIITVIVRLKKESYHRTAHLKRVGSKML